ncbi:MAG: hypothetical protein V3T64_02340, partial [Myxococcota bacterium]
VRDELGLDANEDKKTQRLTNAVIALFERRTNRLWNKRTGFVHEQTVDIHTKTIWVPLFPIETISIVHFDDADDPDTIAATDIVVLKRRGRISLIASSSTQRIISSFARNVTSTITGGHSVGGDEAPEDVIEALLLQLKFALTRHSNDKIAQSTQGFEGGSTTFLGADLHPHFKSVVKSHRRFAH